MTWVVDPRPTPWIAVAGSTARFPVRRVFCVGRNYAKHAREMGHDPDREPPFFFTKPGDAVHDARVDAQAVVPYPPLTDDLHHEIELAVALGRGGRSIPAERALDHVYGYAPAVDLTRRDLQAAAKAARRPWDWGKAFDHSAPIGALRPAADIGHPGTGKIWLTVDGVPRQEADLAELIWPVADVIAFASQSVTLAPGDLILTGTPAGVGPIERGQVVDGGIAGVGELRFTVR